jgi:TetR/AcrR family transcriptional repressor of multidrug resistance operon
MRPKNLEKEEAIRTIALKIIAEEGLENLTMQKLAKAANISPRTIYIKYDNKEDLLVTLYIEEVLSAYELAVLQDFSFDMDLADGVKKLWLNGFTYFKNNRHAFALMQYGKSSPLLSKAYQAKNIKQGDYFGPVMRFLEHHTTADTIRNFHHDIQRALLFSPLIDLMSEYFDYQERPEQIITEETLLQCCDVVIKGMLK